MHRLAVLLLFFGLSLPAQERDLTKGIVFCTYNLQNYVGDDQVASAGRRARRKSPKEIEALIATLREIQPDILGVCEMGSKAMFADFRERLAAVGMAFEHAEYLEASDPDRHIALLSKFPIVARNSQAKVSFQLDGLEETMKRGILDVTVQVTPAYQLRCVGAHLKSKLPTPGGEALIRRHEATKLREHLDEIFRAAPAVNLLCYGDFNDTKNEPVFQEVAGVKGTAGHLSDLWAKDQFGDRWTYYWRTADQYSRIDYIFASQGLWPEVRRDTATVHRTANWLEASDHRPVHVTLVPLEK